MFCGERVFAVAAPTVWNKLPCKLCAISTLSTFKKGLKHIFVLKYIWKLLILWLFIRTSTGTAVLLALLDLHSQLVPCAFSFWLCNKFCLYVIVMCVIYLVLHTPWEILFCLLFFCYFSCCVCESRYLCAISCCIVWFLCFFCSFCDHTWQTLYRELGLMGFLCRGFSF